LCNYCSLAVSAVWETSKLSTVPAGGLVWAYGVGILPTVGLGSSAFPNWDEFWQVYRFCVNQES